MGDEGTWGFCMRCSRPIHIQTNRTGPTYSVEQITSPRPLVPILEPGSRLAPRCPACEMETFANLANPHPYQRQRVSYTMTRVFQHYVFGEHAP